MSADDAGYLFGCCAACRAPFEPSRALSPEEQSVLYMMSKFQEVSAHLPRSRSDFTGKKHNSHLVTRAKYSSAIHFATRLDPARVPAGLPGWNGASSDFSNKDGMFRSQVASSKKNKPPVKNTATNEPDPEIVQAVRDAQAEAAAAGTDPVAAVVDRISLVSDDVYVSTWGEPDTGVEHAALQDWISAARLEPIEVSLERTTPCCELCNNIWDCWARMRVTMSGGRVVPPASIAVKYSKTTKLFPVPSGDDRGMQERLGCMVAYYLHACLRKLKAAGVPDYAFELARRPATVLLLWLPLHINCMHAEMKSPASSPADPKKGFHNYVGCLDLLISYYVYLCAKADPTCRLSGFPFEKFHVFYMKELSECPPPAWPARDPPYARLHDYVFDEGYPEDDSAAQVGHVSDRLVSLYRDVARPVLDFARAIAAPAAPPLDAAARAFFLSPAEAQELTGDFLATSAANLTSIRVHLSHVGIHAIMWQLRRALARESKEYARELDKWINARMQVEWRNMAASGAASGLDQAKLVYCAQHTRQPELPAPGDDGDDDEAIESLRARGLCSIWKAALRLRAWGFTRVPEVQAPEYYEDEDDAVAGLAGSMGRLRIQNPGRLALTCATTSAQEPTRRTSAAAQRASAAAGAAARAPAEARAAARSRAAPAPLGGAGSLSRSTA